MQSTSGATAAQLSSTSPNVYVPYLHQKLLLVCSEKLATDTKYTLSHRDISEIISNKPLFKMADAAGKLVTFCILSHVIRIKRRNLHQGRGRGGFRGRGGRGRGPPPGGYGYRFGRNVEEMKSLVDYCLRNSSPLLPIQV